MASPHKQGANVVDFGLATTEQQQQAHGQGLQLHPQEKESEGPPLLQKPTAATPREQSSSSGSGGSAHDTGALSHEASGLSAQHDAGELGRLLERASEALAVSPTRGCYLG